MRRGREGVLQLKTEEGLWNNRSVYKRPNGALKKKDTENVPIASEELPVEAVPTGQDGENDRNDLANNRFGMDPFRQMNVDEIFFHSTIL